MAINADNGTKFLALWNGDYQSYYNSQSEADFALINILGFYSRNVEQIRRLFMYSALGQRDKAKRYKYLDNMIKRSFDNQIPDIPLEQLAMNAANKLAKQDVEADKQITVATNPFAGPLFQNVKDEDYSWTCPPGLLGEIANFIYEAAPRPVKEIALAGAIGLMAGICGRAYNVSRTGLNQYVLVLAGTGKGKEGMASGITKLMQTVRNSIPAVMDFIGPSEIASKPALIKYLIKHQCFVSLVGEFGLMLQEISSPSATSAQRSYGRVLLELYNKSGESDILSPSIYSDVEKNTQAIRAPAFSILGESTPESFYASLDETMIAQGLMPRFTCIEYNGERVALNKKHGDAVPSQELIEHIATLVNNCLIMSHANKTMKVEMNAEAETVANAFDKLCDQYINTSEMEVARQLWNRGHIKMLKLAALIAIGINPFNPVIDLACVQWAENLVKRDIHNILKQFESGRAGKESSELNQINAITQIIGDYIRRPYISLSRYQIDERMHNQQGNLFLLLATSCTYNVHRLARIVSAVRMRSSASSKHCVGKGHCNWYRQ
jgi:hypothetical protein